MPQVLESSAGIELFVVVCVLEAIICCLYVNLFAFFDFVVIWNLAFSSFLVGHKIIKELVSLA